MSQTSPNWKRPSDTMKKRLIKKRSSVGRLTSHNHQVNFSQEDGKKSDKISSVAKKRHNPFACGNLEKKPRKEEKEPTSSEVNVFEILDKPTEQSESTDSSYQANIANLQAKADKPLHAVENIENVIDKEDSSEKKSHSAQMTETKRYSFYPTDWSLKNKIRYISETSFSWCSPLKTNEESIGLTDFVRQAPTCDLNGQSGNSPDAKTEFQKCCMVWMHPHIPWLKLFPRIVSDNKIGKPSAIFHSQEVQKTLLNDWTESLSSAFHLLRSKKCPFFYVCSHQFTALFRAASVPGVAENIHAILTPTSRGFREAMKKECVEFSMPLNTFSKTVGQEEDDEDIACIPPEQLRKSDDAPTVDIKSDCDDKKQKQTDETVDEEDIAHTNEGASSWLETLGIDKNKYRSLDPGKVMLQRDIFKMIDNRPESAVLIEGPDTMAFVNFLLNSRSCVPNTGDLAGVPATILAPVAFKGSTLMSHQVKQSSVRQQLSNGDIQEGYIVEISGPLFHTNVQGLNHLFSKTQKDFTFTCSTQESSTPFNLFCSSKLSEQLTIDKVEGTPPQTGDNLSIAIPINDINNGRQAIREMTFADNSYTWS